MDLHLRHAAPTDEERAAVDALLGPPSSSWDGGERGDVRDAHVAHGGRETRERRTRGRIDHPPRGAGIVGADRSCPLAVVRDDGDRARIEHLAIDRASTREPE